MSDLLHTTTHVDDALARLLECFKNKANFEGVASVVLRRMQAIEDVVWDLYTGVWLDNAVGVQLDNLGGVVGEARKNRQDEQYRLYIRARIRINRSNGRVSDILAVTRLILGPAPLVTYTPQPPAAYQLEIVGATPAVVDVAALLNEVRPAGVGMGLVYSDDAAIAFTYGSVFSPADPLLGYGDSSNPATGGHYSGVI